MNNIKLYLPVKEARTFGWQRKIRSLDDFQSKFISQRFGENLLNYSQFGLEGHSGIDIPLKDRTEIYASHDGIITFTGLDSAGGIGVDLWNKEGKFKTRYWHLRAYKPKVGELLKAGDLIGWGDSTGFSTGHHLHFALKRTDVNNNTINHDNGYFGAIDPEPYFVWFNDDMLNKEEIVALQALEGYTDQKGVDYWGKGDKKLIDYLKARSLDKIKELKKIND